MRLVGRLRRSRAVDQHESPSRRALIGARATNVSGVRPDGNATTVAVADAGGSAALLFLTASCYGCQPLWEGAAASGDDGPAVLPVPLVIVTPSPSTEDARLVAALAPAGIPVVMASDTWHAYHVARAPWFVGVTDGIVVADHLAPDTWAALVIELAGLVGPAAGLGGPEAAS